MEMGRRVAWQIRQARKKVAWQVTGRHGKANRCKNHTAANWRCVVATREACFNHVFMGSGGIYNERCGRWRRECGASERYVAGCNNAERQTNNKPNDKHIQYGPNSRLPVFSNPTVNVVCSATNRIRTTEPMLEPGNGGNSGVAGVRITRHNNRRSGVHNREV